jgi:signal transduction histidine kinase
MDAATGDMDIWMEGLEDGYDLPERYHVPYFNHPGHNQHLEHWKNGDSYAVIEISGPNKKSYDNYFFFHTDFARVPEDTRNLMMSQESFTSSMAYMKYGAIGWAPAMLDKEQVAVLQRFAKVFEQTYTRFLDLQRAEAQAREAQIEAALERVRSRSLAMHHSIELEQVVGSLFDRLLELGLSFDGALIFTFDKEKRNIKLWIATTHLSDPAFIDIPYDEDISSNTIIRDLWAAIENEEVVLSKSYCGEIKNEYFRYIAKYNGTKIPDSIQQIQQQTECWTLHCVAQKNSMVGFDTWSGHSTKDEDFQILKRFAKVFDQAYIRFLDLQKSEAQAREAQIEAALERVRAQTMAMHNSEDVGKCVVRMFAELTALGVDEGTRFGIGILNHDNENNQLWTAKKNEEEVKLHIGNLDMASHPLLKSARMAWKVQVPFHKYVLEGEDLVKYYQMLNTAPDYKIQIPIEKLPEKEIQHCFIFEHGFFYAFTPHEFQPDVIHIIQRFTSLFAQTYRRYLDLVKAEAQAREAQIEAALERVRSRSMAMHKSEELREVLQLIFEQLRQLNFNIDSAQFDLNYKESDDLNVWTAVPGQVYPSLQRIPYIDTAIMNSVKQAKEKELTFFSHTTSFDEKNEFFRHFFEQAKNVPEDRKRLIFDAPGYARSIVFLNNLFLGVQNYSGVPFTESENQILIRFGKVFEQSYTRFLDLKKAEAQAREAQIEAALERIRSRSMAMHKSDELLNVITVVSEQLQHLGLKFNTVSFAVNNREHDYKFWFVAMGDTNPTFIQVPYLNNPMYDRLKDVLASGADFYSDTLTPEESRHWHEHLFAHASLPNLPEETRAYILRSGYARSIAIMPSIMLVVSNYAVRPYTQDENDIIKRMATVFQQSYTRFLDLQKAEAQAREAQIEAALERVRSKAMAMQTSDDLNALIGLIFTEVTRLGLYLDRCLVLLVNPKTLDTQWILANPELPSHPVSYHVKYHEHTPYLKYLEAWKNRTEKWEYVLEGKEKLEWDDFIFEETELKNLPAPAKEVMQSVASIRLNASFGNFGNLTFSSFEQLTEQQFDVLVRFAKVIDLTYTRFNDLKQAEAQAREAIRQASLNRIRADIASMRTAEDLNRITPLIWKELTALSIPFSRCGVFIMDDAKNQIHTFLSTPDGNAIAAFHLPMDNPGNLAGAVEHWREHKVYVTHWVDQDFQAQADLLVQLGAITSRNQYLSKVPDGGIYLHLLPFMHGMLYVGNTAPLSEDELNLVQSLADAFSVAYARYEDFRQLELAKKEVDKAFTELKQAQQQLVQSEKMASLGELTAGIAHEIQNPLNFVNNFSEVSNELIKEIQDLRQKTHKVTQDTEEDTLLKDIASNLEKINFHGKRADAIVKSMLQHSRTSSGKKELTDINVLCDEYLRLAYHGYRAKDKSFNAKFESQLDPSLPKVNVMAQDIGRVVLNLINNAFYVVNEKARLQAEGFMPQVTVVTRKLDSTIEISVKDNGNGIPDSIKEKIFQPFFTTKPTGQGTGLGLSLAYDIVTKGHGGELKVETEEGKGTAFIINLPMAV